MKGHVKLTTAEYRAWRVNKAQWVSPQGVVLRAVTPEEEQALFPVVERVKRSGRTETYPVTAIYKVRSPAGPIVEQRQTMNVTVRATRTGRDAQSFLFDVFVGGNRYVKGREIICKRMLKRHGECVVFQPNGKRLIVVRDPKIARPTFAESQRSAPHPDHCPCRSFSDRREVGRHHIACEWNSKAPPHEQATPFLQEVPQTFIDSPEPLETLAFDPTPVTRGGVDRQGQAAMRLPPAPLPQAATELPMRARTAASRSMPTAVPLSPAAAARHPTLGAPMYTAAPEVPTSVDRTTTPNPRQGSLEIFSPEQCPEDCRGLRDAAAAWAWPPGRSPTRGHHHPLCPHEGPYQQRFGQGRRWVLFDMQRRVEVRDATADEVARSEVELQRSGTRSVAVSGNIYGVVPTRSVRQTAEAIAAETRAQRPSAARTAQYETARQTALEDSGLPGVPGESARTVAEPRGPADDPQSELAQLRARIAELEYRESLGRPVGPGAVASEHDAYGYERQPPRQPAPPPMLSPYEQQLVARPVGMPADHLRDAHGLVGHQQQGDDIPVGEVVPLTDPEPFVDPLPAMRVAHASAAAPYHPGVVHSEAFVPPPLPGDEHEPATSNELIVDGAEPGPDDEDDESETDEETPIAALAIDIAVHAESPALQAQLGG
jgi:hypothetical protein